MKNVIVALSAIAGLVAVGCDQQDPTSPSAENLGSAQFSNGIDAGGYDKNDAGIFGSDTLKVALNNAIHGLTDANLPKADFNDFGKGSGVGEACLRNGSKSAGWCPTFDGGIPYQTIAGMSRDLKISSTGDCANTSVPVDAGPRFPGSGCCPGERSNVIALDGVDIWVASNATITDVEVGDISKLFCGNNDATSTTFATGCITGLDGGFQAKKFTFKGDAGTSVVTLTPNTIFRRDDNSGTTNAFQSLAVCNKNPAAGAFAFCLGTVEVTDSPTGTAFPFFTTFDDGGHAYVESLTATTGPCAAGDDATTCIGKLVASDAGFIGYAGGSASNTTDKSLSVKEIAPTTANIQKLIYDGPNAYPFARRLYLNENIDYTSKTKAGNANGEADFYDWIYGDPNNESGRGAAANHRSTFEGVLTTGGFIACSASTGQKGLECGQDGGVGVCYGADGGAKINDGRGAGACEAAPPTKNLTCVR